MLDAKNVQWVEEALKLATLKKKSSSLDFSHQLKTILVSSPFYTEIMEDVKQNIVSMWAPLHSN